MLQVAPESFEFNDFSLGLNWINAPDSLDVREMLQCKNFNITRTKGLVKRLGCTRYQSTAAGTSKPILAQFEYYAPDGNKYDLIACDTKVVYYSSGWQEVETGLTSGVRR